MKYYIPDSIDIDSLIEQIPVGIIKPFKKQHLLYILDLIASIPANNKGMMLKNGFVPINAKALQNRVRNYKQYLDYLVTSGIFLRNNHYIPGEKSRGYKYAPAFLKPVRSILDREEGIIISQRPKPTLNLSAAQCKQYQHLIKWYDASFEINQNLAMSFIQEDYKRKVRTPSLIECNEFTGQCKDPVEQYNSSLYNIEKFSSGSFQLSIDEFGKRMHSPLTNLRSELRNLLTYDHLPLASVDINNSQPYLSTLLFTPSFWNSSKDIKELAPAFHTMTYKSLGLTLTDIFNRYDMSSFIMLCKRVETCIDSDVHTYTEIVRSGRFYEYMAEQTNTKSVDRSKLKAAIFQVLFTDNRYIGQESAAPKRKFREIFPHVYSLFSLIKRGDKSSMPKLLQRIESHIILSVITNRISKEKPDLPIFTIHDSIVTIQGFEQYVAQVMEHEMKRIVGLPPKLTISQWKPDNLAFKNGELFHEPRQAA